MKIEELLEMAPPYHPKGEKPPRHWAKKNDFFISFSAIHRAYDEIGFANFTTLDLIFYMSKEAKTVFGGYEDTDPFTQELGFRVIFVLDFKSKLTIVNFPKQINRRKCLQVQKVHTLEKYQDRDIAQFVYQLLVSRGFTIISDTTQLDGGVGLWKKMARQAHLNDYQIHIIDDEEGFLKDGNGDLLTYNSKNIDDAIIWTHDLDFSGQHKLLVMISK